jgi:hypothetical protein
VPGTQAAVREGVRARELREAAQAEYDANAGRLRALEEEFSAKTKKLGELRGAAAQEETAARAAAAAVEGARPGAGGDNGIDHN